MRRPHRHRRHQSGPGRARAPLAAPARRGPRKRHPRRQARPTDRTRTTGTSRHRTRLRRPTARHRRRQPDRLISEAAFAALCGVSPVEHSSGKTQRHRLNRGGDRAANSALWTIANNRLIHDPRTREYAARRTATGSSRKEIIRLLKRYIVRQVFTEIRRALTVPRSSPQKILT